MSKKLKRAIIKEELVLLTGDFKLAIVLQQAIYWSERTKDFDKFVLEERERYENYATDQETPTIELKNGWFYKSAEELSEETMMNVTAKGMRAYLKQLVENEWLEERNNPKLKMDRTKQYRVNIIKIQQDLLKLGYALEGYSIDLSYIQKEKCILPEVKCTERKVKCKGDLVKCKGDLVKAIPEITTKITTEINNNKEIVPLKKISINHNGFDKVVVVNINLKYQRAFYNPTVKDIDYLVENYTALNIFKILNEWGIIMSYNSALYYNKDNIPNLFLRMVAKECFDIDWSNENRYQILKAEIEQKLSSNINVSTISHILKYSLGFKAWERESNTVTKELLQSILNKKSVAIISETLTELKRQYDEYDDKEVFFQKSLGAWLYHAFFKTRIVLQKPIDHVNTVRKYDSTLMG